MLTIMSEDPQARLFSRTDDNFREQYARFRRMLVVDYEYTTVFDMTTSLNMRALRESVNDYLLHSKERIIKKVKKKFTYGRGHYMASEPVTQDDEAKIINGISFLLNDLGKAGFCHVEYASKTKKILTFGLAQSEVVTSLKRVNFEKIFNEEKLANNFEKK